jgi:hypothetical protein
MSTMPGKLEKKTFTNPERGAGIVDKVTGYRAVAGQYRVKRRLHIWRAAELA